jgi:hypothetical protein
MARKRKRRNIRRVSADTANEPHGAVFAVLVFLAAFVIVALRRPDAILNPQFYAEDGMQWYPDAYRFGLHSYLMPVAGYLHAFIRTVALFAVLVPFSLAPFVMNVCAIAVQIAPLNFFLTSRFSRIKFRTRLLGCAVYLAIPNSWEINANLTNVQWHLALLACLVLLAQPTQEKLWRIFDATVLVLTSFSSPIGILLVPVAAALWWKRRERWSAVCLALIIPGALVESLVSLLSQTRQVAPLGANLMRLATILGDQVFFSALFGFTTQYWFTRNDLIIIAVIATIVGTAVLSCTVWYGPVELKIFILFCFAVLALGLARPLAGPPVHPQWLYLCISGRATRYYFFPMLAFFSSLFWIAGRPSPKWLRYFAIVLLTFLSIGIVQDWRYPAYKDLDFQHYATQFEQAPAGTRVTIPINPNMKMEITKR